MLKISTTGDIHRTNMYVHGMNMYEETIYVYVPCTYMYIHMCTYFWCLTRGVIRVSDKLVDGLLCFCSIWPGIKNITIFWTGTALIHIVPSIRRQRDIPHSCICISLSATKTCSDSWLYHVHTLYIHAHTLYIHVHCLYISPKY